MDTWKTWFGANNAEEVNGESWPRCESTPEDQGGVGTEPATNTEPAKFEGSSTVAPEAWPSLGVLE